MKNKKIYDLVVASLILAMIVILTFTPIGYIPTPLLSITIVHIPVLVGEEDFYLALPLALVAC